MNYTSSSSNNSNSSNSSSTSTVMEFIDYRDVSDPTKESFFVRIGSPKLVVAPMVDQSELSYRMMTRKYGAQLVFTQMFNSNSFVTSKGTVHYYHLSSLLSSFLSLFPS